MSLENIDIFVEVVDARSFSRAAKRLSMPTSTVSAKIARLEQRLGATLIKRTTRQLNVTPAGARYYQHCVKALAEIANAEQALSEDIAGASGLLRITVPPDIANSLLAPVVQSYLQQYPDVSIELIVTNRQVDLIAENIDLAIRIGPLADSSLMARKYFSIRAGLWATPQCLQQYGTPEHAEDLLDYNLIQISQLKEELRLINNSTGDTIELTGNSRIYTDDVLNCRVLIEAGTGIGVLPNFIAQASSSNLIPVLPDLISESIDAFFVYPSQRFVPKKLRAFVNVALAETLA